MKRDPSGVGLPRRKIQLWCLRRGSIVSVTAEKGSFSSLWKIQSCTILRTRRSATERGTGAALIRARISLTCVGTVAYPTPVDGKRSGGGAGDSVESCEKRNARAVRSSRVSRTEAVSSTGLPSSEQAWWITPGWKGSKSGASVEDSSCHLVAP